MGPLSELHFIRPGWLAALAMLVPLLWVGLRNTRSPAAWRRVCDAHLLPHVMTQGGGRARHWPLALMAIGWIACCLALAGPAWERLPQSTYRAPAQRVFVLNLSPSMDAEDVGPSRLARARYELGDALEALGDGQAGLVIFAEEPYVVTPISDDPKIVASFLPVLEPGLMPGRGVRVDRAIDEARTLLDQAGATSGGIVLVTDSAGDRPADAVRAAADAARAGYPVSVLAVGTEAGAPVPTSRGFLRDSRGQAVMARLDLGALEKIADAGRGQLAELNAGDEDIDLVLGLQTGALQAADPFSGAEPLLETGATADVWRDMGLVLVWVVALLAPLAFRRGWATTIALVLLVGAGTLPAQTAEAGVRDWMWTPDQLGAEAFEEGRHGEASELFADPAWRAASLYRDGRFTEAAEILAQSEAPDDQYNLGNALARAGQLEQAIAAYDRALEQSPDHEDARHNRDVVAKLLEEQKQQQEQQSQQGQQGQQGEQKGDAEQAGEGSEASSDASSDGSEEGQPSDADGSSGDEQHGDDARDGGSQGGSDDAGESGTDGSDDDANDAPQPGSASSAREESSDSPSSGDASARASAGADAADPRDADSGSGQENAEADAEREADAPAAAQAGAGEESAGDEQHAASGAAGASNESTPTEPTASDEMQRQAAAPGDEQRGELSQELQREGVESAPSSSMASAPLSEREQAVERWLNRVSDDPGGLLREKLRRRYAQKRYLDSTRGRIQ